MQASRQPIALLIGSLVLVAACGGTPTGTANPGGGGGATVDPGGGGGTVTQPPVETPPAATDPSTGGGGGGDVCSLLTLAEIETAFEVSGVTQRFFAGPPDTCDYQLDGAPFLVLNLSAGFGSFAFDAMAADANSTAVSGIGDRALYNSQQLTFFIQKGDDLLLTIAILDESRSEQERFELMLYLAGIADDRM